jgi:hypothetical protein
MDFNRFCKRGILICAALGIVFCVAAALLPGIQTRLINIARQGMKGISFSDALWRQRAVAWAIEGGVVCALIGLLALTGKTKKFPVIALIAVFILCTLIVFDKAYFFGVYISPDSTNYLRAAKSLLDGYGFYVNTAAGDTSTYFTWFPVGYPVLIALTAFITGTEVYLASKILALIIVAVIFTMLYQRFSQWAWIIALVIVANTSFFEIFCYTWSEQPFTLGLFLLAFAASDALHTGRVKVSTLIGLYFASALLFFTRYAGAFAVVVPGLIALYYLFAGVKNKMRQHIVAGVCYGFVTILSAMTLLGYLYWNHLHNAATGGRSIEIDTNLIDLILRLGYAQMMEAANQVRIFFKSEIPFAALLYVLLLLCAVPFVLPVQKIQRSWKTPEYVLIETGVIYGCAIIALRILYTSMGPLYYRYFFPGSALIFSGLALLVIKQYGGSIHQRISIPHLPVLVCAFVFLSLFFHHAKRIDTGYSEIRKTIIADLADVPAKSLLILPSYGYTLPENYTYGIRTDVMCVRPQADTKTDAHSFLEQIDRFDHVYVYARNMTDPLYSLLQELNLHGEFDQGAVLVKVK